MTQRMGKADRACVWAGLETRRHCRRSDGRSGEPTPPQRSLLLLCSFPRRKGPRIPKQTLASSLQNSGRHRSGELSTEPRTSPASSSLPLSFFSGFVQMAPETAKTKLDRRDFKRTICRRSPLDGSDSEISCSPPHDPRSKRWRSSLETPITGDAKAAVMVKGLEWSFGGGWFCSMGEGWLVRRMKAWGELWVMGVSSNGNGGSRLWWLLGIQ
ncbi:hypothetical protein V6N11_075115 [Hibiscus sabdariffa]|uniref:Uncharacterized protein n=1 Tax=Hibiscus sabdariffa TaxID=183260 RepID=A0ABR2R5Z7_9ROSI